MSARCRPSPRRSHARNRKRESVSYTSPSRIYPTVVNIERRDALSGPREAEAVLACDVVAGLSRRSTLVVYAREARSWMCRSAVCQCYDQGAVAPSGVQAALNGPLRVVVRPSVVVDRSGGRSGAPFRRTSVRRRTGAARSFMADAEHHRPDHRVLTTVGLWASGVSPSTRASGGGGDPTPQRDALRLGPSCESCQAQRGRLSADGWHGFSATDSPPNVSAKCQVKKLSEGRVPVRFGCCLREVCV
jgi:hypothetical protein